MKENRQETEGLRLCMRVCLTIILLTCSHSPSFSFFLSVCAHIAHLLNVCRWVDAWIKVHLLSLVVYCWCAHTTSFPYRQNKLAFTFSLFALWLFPEPLLLRLMATSTTTKWQHDFDHRWKRWWQPRTTEQLSIEIKCVGGDEQRN